MVRAYIPQSFSRGLVTNTNFPPQGPDLPGGRFPDGMLYENLVLMEFEDGVVMDYET